MNITRNGSQPSINGPIDWYTGTVRIDPLFLNAEEPARATGGSVTFEPGARTAGCGSKAAPSKKSGPAM